MEDIEANDSLRRILPTNEEGFRKLQHYGNPDDWGDWAPHVAKNTADPKHAYESYRDYYAAKTGQAPETKRLSPEHL